MYYVYVNKRKGRVLLTSQRLRDPQWRLAAVHTNPTAAKRHARFIANVRDYILEWDLYI